MSHDSSSRALDMLLHRKSAKKASLPLVDEQPTTPKEKVKADEAGPMGATAEATVLRPLCIRIPKAANLIGVGRTKIYHLINRGELETVKIDGSVAVTMRSLEAYVFRNATVRTASLK